MRTQVSEFFKAERLTFSLPLFITRANKIPCGVFLFVMAVALYLPSNHFHVINPHLLPMSWVDQAIPFLPLTVWLYISEYLFFVVVYLSCKSLSNLGKYFYSFLALQAVSVFIFWAFPTTYPRSLYPLPPELDGVTDFVFSLLREVDTPANCCPSLHVSSVYLSSFLFLDDQRKKFPFFFTWGTAIAISTLTTKQHYLIDIVGGFVMAALAYWFFFRFITYTHKR